VDRRLLDDDDLALSAVVANCAMNRERQLAGVNSYSRELGFNCVHGLHYVGDKLATVTRAASWLTDDGLLVADLDLASIRLPDGRPAGRALSGALRRAGFDYDARRRRISIQCHADERVA
jgi:hypothetical protein